MYCQWLESRRAKIHYFDLRFPLPDDVIYATGVYTDPEFRNQGIAFKNGSEFLHDCKRKSFHHVFAVVDPKSMSSLALHRKLGFVAYQTAHYRRYLFLRHYTVEEPESGKSKTWLAVWGDAGWIWKAFWPDMSYAS